MYDDSPYLYTTSIDSHPLSLSLLSKVPNIIPMSQDSICKTPSIKSKALPSLHSSQSSISVKSKHAIRLGSGAVVLGSEVVALGRDERVPLGEEGDGWGVGC